MPDLAPLYRKADIVLAPIPFGGGTKNKTLEAMAWSRAVVGTPQAFTGISMRPGVAFLPVPLDAAIVAHAVARLAARPDLRGAMGAAGRAYVVANHTQDIVDERVAARVRQGPPVEGLTGLCDTSEDSGRGHGPHETSATSGAAQRHRGA